MITHQPRLAWDTARAFVAACESADRFRWLTERVNVLLGPAYAAALTSTRQHLLRPSRPDAPQVEVGTWRARIDDLLRRQPDLTGPLSELVSQVRPDPRPYWPVN